MTDRIAGLFVVLDHDIREDDVQSLVDAVKHMRNVTSVGMHVSDFDTHIAEERARRELATKIWDVLRDKDPR